ncbi:MAG: glycosyltransferase family 1 protein [Candidatus Competibacteraceae bacterium]|nr:glycosyltransferase family 1 protein [Candidatus Competibacteraceae bacterium]
MSGDSPLKIGLFPVMIGRRGGGPETYERQLIQTLARIAPQHDYRVYCLSRAAAAALEPLPVRVARPVLGPGPRTLSMMVSLPLALARDRPDLLHVTFTPPPVSPRAYVFTLHDISMFVHPEFYPVRIRLRLNALIRLGLRQARLILCISEHGRQMARERFGIAEERLAVAYHGVDACYRPVPQSEARQRLRRHYGLEGSYLLYLGKYERRKNIFRLLEAFRLFRERNDGVKLVMAGKRDWNAAAVDRLIAQLELDGQVLEPGYIPLEHLPALYSAAHCFVFPSLWEGFGLPVIEAMACGTPVITSRGSCLEEIAGGAARLVDPHRVEDIAQALEELYRNPALGGELRRRGLIRAAQFSWEACARQTLAAYRQALAL